MKKILFLVAISAIPMLGNAQIEVKTEVLDENNMGLTLSDGGVFLAQPNIEWYGEHTQVMTLPGCEFPKGSGNHVLNGLSLWFGGVDEFDEPRISAPTHLAYEDQFGGPLSIGDLNNPHETIDFMYTVSREEIDFHITNYQNPNYLMPESIANWPAHGDVSFGLDFYLAPYVSVTGEDYYNPYLGDYPCIEGDRATYIIMNDRIGPVPCGGPKNFEYMGVEIHYMFYQYSSIPELANTTFCKAKVINRSETNYPNFTTSLYTNAAIGSMSDDFMATDQQRNLIYAYNGDEVDDEYGTRPPAVGVVSLNHTIDRSRVFGDYSNYAYHLPSFPPEFWEVLQGNLLTGDSHPSQFGFSGDPLTGQGDIQTAPQQTHSMIYSIDIGEFQSGDEHTFDFAIVVGQGETNLESIEELRESTDFAQDFYSQSSGDCVQATIGIPAIIDPPAVADEDDDFSSIIYPNPSNGDFTVQVDEEWVGADLTVYSSSGLVLQNINNVKASQNQVLLTTGPGVYLVTLEKDGVTKIVKAVVE